jgi:hypothetical protein
MWSNRNEEKGSQSDLHIESEELQPLREVASLILLYKQLFCSLYKDGNRAVHQRLICDHIGHTKRTVHTSSVLGVVFLVPRAEQTLQPFSFRRGLLYWVEFSL